MDQSRLDSWTQVSGWRWTRADQLVCGSEQDGGGDGWTLRTQVDTVDQSLVGQLDTVGIRAWLDQSWGGMVYLK